MPTITSAGSGLWSAGATWVGGSVPANNDTVVIASGHVVEFNVDQSGFADGIAGITITGGLSLTRTTGTYYLKIKAAATIAGAGTFDCGTLASPIPFATKHTITGGAGWYIDGASGMTMTAYAAEPTVKSVKLSNAESIGDTRLEIDTNITGDIWTIGDTIVICNIASNRNAEVRVIGAITSTYIDITAGLTSAKLAGSEVVLRTRNLKIIGNTGYLIRAFTEGKLTVGGGEYSGTVGSLFSHGSIPIITGGVISGVVSYINSVKITMSTCVVVNNEQGITGTASGISISNVLFAGNEYSFSGTLGAVISNCKFFGNKYSLVSLNGAIIRNGEFRGNFSGVASSSATIENTTFSANYRDIDTSIVNLTNCLLGSTTENSSYSSLAKEIYSESLDHDQVAGAFKSWTKGGVTSSVASPVPTGYTKAYQIALESATSEGFWQREITVGAGASVNIEMWLRKSASMTYLPRCLVFLKSGTDPFAGGTPLKTFTMTNSVDTFESDLYTYTNSGSEDVTLVIRFQGMNATGTVTTALKVTQINVDLTTALAQLALIVADTNELQVELADGGRTDLLLDAAANVWTAENRTLTSLGSFGSLGAEIWAYVPRTLTMTAAQIQAAVNGTAIACRRGDTFQATLTGISGSLNGKLYFTVKKDKSDVDSRAIIQVSTTGGLTIVNRAAYTPSSDGSLTVTDPLTGSVQIILAPAVTRMLVTGNLYYDIQTVNLGAVVTVAEGLFTVSEDVTRAIT